MSGDPRAAWMTDENTDTTARDPPQYGAKYLSLPSRAADSDVPRGCSSMVLSCFRVNFAHVTRRRPVWDCMRERVDGSAALGACRT